MEEEKQTPHVDSKEFKTKTILLTLLAVVLIFSSSSGVYYWQHKKLKQVQLQLAQSSQSNSSLESKIGALNKQVASLDSQSTQSNGLAQSAKEPAAQTVPVADLTIKVLDGYRYYTTQYPNNPYVVVDVTLTNNSSTSLPVPVSSFNLRDSSGNGGGSFGELAGTTMPNGKTILGDQTLAAGQTVTGGLTFSAFNKNATTYTLTNKSQTFPVDASTSAKQQ